MKKSFEEELASVVIRAISKNPKLRKRLKKVLSVEDYIPVDRIPTEEEVESVGGTHQWLRDHGMSTRTANIIARRALTIPKLLSMSDDTLLGYHEFGEAALEEWNNFKRRVFNK